MSEKTNFKDLRVWQESKEIAREVYLLCKTLPQDEMYGLCSQMKRAAVSVPSNIAEGYRRNGHKEFLQFLGIASGSCAELETQLILTQEIFQINTEMLQIHIIQVQKMLNALIVKIKSRH
jgi:four helix bundle protein